MKLPVTWFTALGVAALLLPASPVATAAEAVSSPLRDYVAAPDASYQVAKRREGKVLTAKFVELTLTSQTWQGIAWKHQLFVIKPASARPDAKHALLFIAGGRWRDELAQPPTDDKLPGEARMLALAAEQLKTPVAILLQVPQQPIFGGLVEDEIISLTFEKYIRTGDPQWPLLLPMVKSAVRGMDAVQAFAKDEWQLNLETFTVTGASKRGWTTWLTGAVDPRAVAIAPMVIDVLNMGPQMKHQKATWGDLSEEVAEYKERRLDEMIDTPRGQQLLSIVDPYSYREQLTQPKIVILGTNDRYWPLDALNLYWDGLNGQKHVLYIPNNGHGLQDLPRIVGAIHALQQQQVAGKALPKLTWQHKLENGHWELAIGSDIAPATVRIWTARSASKDFRDARWQSEEVEVSGASARFARPLPKQGYAAMFAEAEFRNLDLPYFLSSQVKIVGEESAE